MRYLVSIGSAEERQVVEFVNRYSTRVGEDIYHEEKTTDVSFSISVPEDTQVGSDVTVSLIIKNTSTEVRSVHGRMTILSSFYTGIPAKRLESRSYHNELLAGESKQKIRFEDLDSNYYHNIILSYT